MVALGSDRYPQKAAISIAGIKRVKLVADPNGIDQYDHVDWLSPVIKLKK